MSCCWSRSCDLHLCRHCDLCKRRRRRRRTVRRRGCFHCGCLGHSCCCCLGCPWHPRPQNASACRTRPGTSGWGCWSWSCHGNEDGHLEINDDEGRHRCNHEMMGQRATQTVIEKNQILILPVKVPVRDQLPGVWGGVKVRVRVTLRLTLG